MKLEESIKRKKFVVTAEVQPPIEVDVKELSQSVGQIRGKIDALTVPDLKIEGLVTDTMGTCRILKEQKFEPILQTTCREKSRLDIQEQLLKISEAGIDNSSPLQKTTGLRETAFKRSCTSMLTLESSSR